MKWDALTHINWRGHDKEFQKALGLEDLESGQLIRGIERNMASMNMWALPVYEVEGGRGMKRVYVTVLKNRATGEDVYVNSTTWVDEMTGEERIVTAYPYSRADSLRRDCQACITYYLKQFGVASGAARKIALDVYSMLEESGVPARYWPYAIEAMVSNAGTENVLNTLFLKRGSPAGGRHLTSTSKPSLPRGWTTPEKGHQRKKSSSVTA